MNQLVEDNPASRRFEILVDGSLAGFISYRLEPGGTIVLEHTKVDRAFTGKGVGSALARGALDQLRNRGDRVRLTCSFLIRFVERHPEYASMVAEG